MMKAILTLTLFLFALSLNAQCTVEDIFPLPHGISKFKATSVLASKKNIIEDKEANQMPFFHKWIKLEYLHGDSVYEAYRFYNFYNHPCFKGKENNLSLLFVDDVLYRMEITITFSSDDFDKCMESYSTLVNILKTKFPYMEEYIQKNNLTKEQEGEGYYMYSSPLDERDQVKIRQIVIGYSINYKKEWNDFTKKYNQLGIVENYLIELSSVDLYGTKLTNEGF